MTTNGRRTSTHPIQLRKLEHTTLAELRKTARKSQSKLAQAAGFSQSRVGQIENDAPAGVLGRTLETYVKDGLGHELLYIVSTGHEAYILRRVTPDE